MKVSFRRVMVVLRRQCPLIPVFICLALGQFLAWWTLLAVGFGVGGLLWFFSAAGTRSPIASASLFLAVGCVIGSLYVLPRNNPSAPEGTLRGVVATVVESPRHRKVGESEFSLELLGTSQADFSVLVPSQKFSQAVPWSYSRSYCTARDLPWLNAAHLRQGDFIIFQASFRRLRESISPFSFENYLRRNGISGTCKISALETLKANPQSWPIDRFRDALLEKLRLLVGEGESYGLIAAMFFGQRDVLSDETELLFKRSGLAHLLVVSGVQVTLIGMLCSAASRRLVRFSRLSRTGMANICAYGVGTAAAFLYAQLTGLDSAGSRAAVATALAALAILSERGQSWGNAVAGSGVVILVLVPGAVFDPGIHLTFTALFSFLIARSCSPVRSLQFGVALFLTPMATGIVAWLWFGTFSVASLWLNIFLAPAFTFVSCHGVLLALGLWAIGIDPEGRGLQCMAALLERLVELLTWLDWAAPQVVTEDSQVYFVGAAGVLISGLALIASRQWLRRNREVWVRT